MRNGPSAADSEASEPISPQSDVHELVVVVEDAVMPLSEAYESPMSQKF